MNFGPQKYALAAIPERGRSFFTHHFSIAIRIAVNTRFLLSGRLEGLGWYTHEIMRRMVVRHPEDEFIFLFDRPFDPSFVYAENVRPVVLFPPARHPLLWYLWFEWSLPWAFQKYRPDVFFSPDSYLSLSSKVPTVMTCHDLVPLHSPHQVPWAPRWFYRRFLSKYLHKAKQIVTVSEYVRRDIQQTCQIDLDKISTVYNGCREGFLPLQDMEKQAVKAAFSQCQEYFFYAGAIHPRKNIPRLIRAFDELKNRCSSPVKLLLAGRFAWQTGEVKSAFESARHKSDIVFLGYVPDEQLPRLLGAALALTYVSLSEGFGLPILEAFHAEVPVIAANDTALPEVADDAALLVNPLSESDIAQAMQRLLDDPAMRQKLVEKGRQRRTLFDWDEAAERIYQIIKATAMERTAAS